MRWTAFRMARMRHDGLAARRNGQLQNEFVAGIGECRPPWKMNLLQVHDPANVQAHVEAFRRRDSPGIRNAVDAGELQACVFQCRAHRVDGKTGRVPFPEIEGRTPDFRNPRNPVSGPRFPESAIQHRAELSERADKAPIVAVAKQAAKTNVLEYMIRLPEFLGIDLKNRR